jgi:hypothetical protein
MKTKLIRLIVLPLLLSSAAHAFVNIPIWTENFESYTADDPPTAIESQTNGDWLTDPIESNSFVIDASANYGLSGSFGSSVLVVGGVDPVEPAEIGLSYIIGPTAAYYNPGPGDLTGFRFRMDFIISSGLGTDLVDSFRFGFYDQSAETPNPYSFYSFIPGEQEGEINIVKNNTSSSIVSGVTIEVNAAYTLDIWADMSLNQAFAYIYNVGGSPASGFTLFNTQVFNAGNEDDNNLGDFTIDWISADGESWDDNYMIIDNLRIDQVPEPSAALLGLLSAAALLRRRRN